MTPLADVCRLAAWTDVSIDVQPYTDVDGLRHTVRLTVSNSGAVAGRDVVQIYVSDPVCSLRRPRKELKGFAKTNLLHPGQAENVTIDLDKLAFSFYDDQLGRWVIEKGDFTILVARSSTNIVTRVGVRFAKTLTWTGL